MNPPGLSIISRPALWREGGQAWHLTEQLRSYSHTIEALGGYWSCQFTIRGGRHLIDDWLQDGLGRHVEVFDDTLTKIWEGFVDRIVANYGPLSVTRGPLTDTANRVWLCYSSVEYDEDDQPVVGSRSRTDDADDTDSQTLWGILPRALSSGGVEATDAEAIRDAYLENHKMPDTSKEWRSDSKAETSVTVDCLGYVHWLNWHYNDATTGTDNADVKIAAVLADSPNVAWLAYDDEHIDSNALQVPMWEDEDNTAWAVVKDAVARGGTSQERWLFGIYNDLEAWYHAAPTTVLYQQRLSQPRSRIEFVSGDEVYPWKVRPGQWIMFPDFLIGQAAEFELRDDPRAMFIERVRFREPWTLELSGSTADTTEALIAQLGLSGIGG